MTKAKRMTADEKRAVENWEGDPAWPIEARLDFCAKKKRVRKKPQLTKLASKNSMIFAGAFGSWKRS